MLAESTDMALTFSIVATIGAALLRQLYTLDESELDQILVIDPNRPESLSWVREITDIVTGKDV